MPQPKTQNKRLLLVVDTQVDFMIEGQPLYVHGAERIIVPALKFLAQAESRYGAVYVTMDTHCRSAYAESEEAAEFPLHCEYETYGWQNVLPVVMGVPNVPTFVQRKDQFDMWKGNGISVDSCMAQPYSTCYTSEEWWSRIFPICVPGDVPTVDVIGDNLPRTGRLVLPTKKNKQRGGHCVCVDGGSYKGKWFWIANSWGQNWGDDGWFKMGFSWFSDQRRLVDDMWTIV